MARCKNSPESLKTKTELAERLREVRTEQFGERGGPELSRRLGLPVRTWYNYEVGVTVPAEVLLRFIELTGVESRWLLHGEGPKYRGKDFDGRPAVGEGPESVAVLLRRALSLLERRREPGGRAAQVDGRGSVGGGALDGRTLTVQVQPIEGSGPDADPAGPECVQLHRQWLGDLRDFLCVRHAGDAMEPMLGDGAFVGAAAGPEPPESLDGALVLAQVEGRWLVRWLQLTGRFALLRAEDAAADEGIIPIDLNGSPGHPRQFRRVLWALTRHGEPAGLSD